MTESEKDGERRESAESAAAKSGASLKYTGATRRYAMSLVQPRDSRRKTWLKVARKMAATRYERADGFSRVSRFPTVQKAAASPYVLLVALGGGRRRDGIRH